VLTRRAKKRALEKRDAECSSRGEMDIFGNSLVIFHCVHIQLPNEGTAEVYRTVKLRSVLVKTVDIA